MAKSDSRAIVDFWRSIGPKAWFEKSDEIDDRIHSEFEDVYHEAANGELDDWLDNAESCLSLIIVMDQFSRNLYRDDPRAFALDRQALAAAALAAERGYENEIAGELAAFFYMPFMHSESITDQDRCLFLLHRTGLYRFLPHARQHRAIIARFGRFPHRNKVLNRHTTPAEDEYLQSGGFRG